MNLPQWFSSTLRMYAEKKMEESIEEENRQIKELAAKFDKLSLAGWDDLHDKAVLKINAEIAAAARDPLDDKGSMLHVTRWNAMRELFDEMTNHVIDTRKRRDEIVHMERELDEHIGTGTY